MKNMKNISKRALALFLTLVMCLGMVNVTVFADEVETTPEPAQLYTCGMDEHEHTDDCYKEQVVKKLVCEKNEDEEHKHTDECYVPELKCGLEEGEGAHSHEEDCYKTETVEKQVLICEEKESEPVETSEGHTHTEDCYKVTETKELTCGLEESEEHTHTDECYKVTETKELSCGQEETPATEGHTHTEDCYKTETVEENVLACEEEESEGHKHTEACWKTEKVLTCKVEEHKHTEACKAKVECEHEWTDGKCTKCEAVCEHEEYGEDGKCTVCGMEQPKDAYTTFMDAMQTILDLQASDDAEVEDVLAAVEAAKAAYNALSDEQKAEEIVAQMYAMLETFGQAETLAITDGGEQTLTGTINVPATIVITQNTILNLSGCTINYTGDTGSVFHVKSGTLTLNGTGTITGGKGTLIKRTAPSVTNSNGKITTASKWTNATETIIKDGKEELNGFNAIIGGKRENVTCGGAILLTGTSQLVMNGGTITGNTAAMGGGICSFRGAKVTIYGGSITNNTANGYAGGGMFLGAKENLIDPTHNNTPISITGNKTTTNCDLGGGGIFVDSAGSLEIKNAVIHDNKAGGLGGGVAGCLHGMVSNLSPDTAAIYSNKNSVNESGGALNAPHTLNNLVDHDDPTLTWTDGLKSNAKDFFVAGFSNIGSRSLGGGSATWVGEAVLRANGKSNVKAGSVSTTTQDPLMVQGLLGLQVTNPGEVAAAVGTVSAAKADISNNYSNMHGGGVGTNGLLTFGETNYSYSSSKITLNATKNVTGFANGSNDGAKSNFTFQLWKGKTQLATAVSDSSGNITFADLSTSTLFGSSTSSGEVTATLTLKEVAGSKLGMTYDTTERTITLKATRTASDPVTVTTHGNGNYVSVATFTDTLTNATVSVGSATFTSNTVTLQGNANFTNKMEYGSLKVTKQLTGSTLSGDENREFTFTVALSAPGKTANWSTVTVTGEGVTVKQDGQATVEFTMSRDKTATISGIPYDAHYVVTETGLDRSDWNAPVYSPSQEGNIGAATPRPEVTVTNQRDIKNVTVKKVVTAATNNDPKFAPAIDKQYTIKVKLGDSNTNKGPFTESTNWDGVGTYTFELTADAEATISNIPSNISVDVTEDTVAAETGVNTDVTWTQHISAPDATGKYTVTNTYYKPQYTDVTVTKEFITDAEGYKDEYKPDSVTVELLRDGVPFGEEGHTYATLPGEDGKWEHTWTGLPMHPSASGEAYKYTVQEKKVKYGDTVLTPDDDGIIRIRGDEATTEGKTNILYGWVVDNGGSGTDIKVKNTWRPAKNMGEAELQIVKLDGKNNQPIQGVGFTLWDKTGATVIGTDTTDPEGKASFKAMPVGEYILEETSVPDAYKGVTDGEGKDVNVGRKWDVTVTRTLTKVTEVKDELDNETQKNIVGVNEWKYDTDADKKGGTLTVYNTPLLGSLTIKKELRGAGNKFFDERDFEGKEFKFKVTVKDAEGNDVPATHVVEKDGKQVEEDVGVVTVEYGETVTITGLRYGTYTVKEIAPEDSGYYTWEGVKLVEVKTSATEPEQPEQPSEPAAQADDKPYESAPPSVLATPVTPMDSMHQIPLTPATPTYGKDKSIEVEVKTNGQEIKVLAGNVYERKLANLTIDKTVVSKTPLMQNEKFIFEVTLTDEYNEPVNVEVSGNVERTGDGKYVVMIEKSELDESKHATATISGIPVGTKYTVTETSRDKWIVEGEPEGSQTLDNENGVEVKITNTRKTGSLTIKKIIEGLPNTDLYKEKTFAFTIEGPAEADGEFEATYSDGSTGTVSFTGGIASVSFTGAEIIAGKYSVTISKLPTGTYQVSEDDAEAQVSGYDLDVVIDNKNVEDKKDPNETTVTNNYKKKPTSSYTSLTVKKVWVGDDVETRPTVIKVQLLKDGKPSGDPVELKASNNWTKRWNNLSEGSKWSVEEVEVPEGYTSKVEKPKSGTTWTITNTYDTDIPDDPTPTSNMLSVNKVWLGDAGANRPDSVSVQVFKDGKLAETVTLNEANGWSWSKALSDEELKSTWSVSEINVPEGYKSTVSGSGTSFTVTNSFGDTDIPEDPTPTTDVPDNPPPLVDWPDYPPPLVDWPLVEIPENPVPMVPAEPEVDIPEDPTPMVGIPQTGDISLAWYAVAALSACGLAVLVLKKREDEEN